MAAFKSSGIAFLSYESRMRRDTSFHHFASVARGGSELATGSNNGSINAAFSASNFSRGSGWKSTPWYAAGNMKVAAGSSSAAATELSSKTPGAGTEVSPPVVGCVSETGKLSEAGTTDS
jgi:hypothetical protein